MAHNPTAVLVVDDNRDAADLLVELFTAVGLQAVSAYSGPQALQLVQSWQPHIVFLDLSMPGMNGFDALLRLRALPQLQGTRIVALTGDADRLRSEIERAGFNALLRKPAAMAEILFQVDCVAAAS